MPEQKRERVLPVDGQETGGNSRTAGFSVSSDAAIEAKVGEAKGQVYNRGPLVDGQVLSGSLPSETPKVIGDMPDIRIYTQGITFGRDGKGFDSGTLKRMVKFRQENLKKAA